jgi:hypothetical protein
MGLLVFVLAVARDGTDLGNDFINWDDSMTLYANPRMNPPTAETIKFYWTHGEYGLYIPGTYTIWAGLAKLAYTSETDLQGSHLTPGVFHAASVVFHALAAVVVFALLRKLKLPDVASCIGACLFALHPVQVESVGWASGLKDVLCGLFALIAVWQYLAAVQCEGTKAAGSLCPGDGGVCVGDALQADGDGDAGHRVRAGLAGPGADVEAGGVVYGAVVADERGVDGGGAAGAAGQRAACAAVAATAGGAGCAGVLSREDCLAGAAHGGLRAHAARGDGSGIPVVDVDDSRGGCGAAVWRGRGRKELIAAAIVLVIAVSPVLGLTPFLFQYFSTVSDHYLYLAMLGPGLALAWVVAKVNHRAVMGGAVGALVVLGALSVRQAGVWRDAESLFTNTLQVNPNSFMATTTSPRAFTHAGDLALSTSDLSNKFGEVEKSKTYRQQAEANYRKSLELFIKAAEVKRQATRDDDYLAAYANVAAMCSRLNENEAALAYREKAIAIALTYPVDARRDLPAMYCLKGHDLLRLGRPREAVGAFEQALRLQPRSRVAVEGRAKALAAMASLEVER